MPEELALTTHEQRQLLDLLDPEAEIEVIIPQSIDAEQLMKTLGLCCRSSMIADRQHTRSNALIGRMLWVVRERSIHREWGFKSFTEFIDEWVKPRLGKSSRLNASFCGSLTTTQNAVTLLAGLLNMAKSGLGCRFR